MSPIGVRDVDECEETAELQEVSLLLPGCRYLVGLVVRRHGDIRVVCHDSDMILPINDHVNLEPDLETTYQHPPSKME
jgi:hypothetical protein